ncbi:MAG: sulfatase family protein [Gammaproteobacteria bacterium]
MERRTLLLQLFAAFVSAARPLRTQRGPNVVLIISDDHGWPDYGFMGHRHVRTPHLDRLASESMVYARGYVPSSLCRPSLASMMTGLYPHQHKMSGNDPQGDARDPENRARMVRVFQRSKTVAGLLAERGYVSHQSGKWWEGECKCGGFTECMTHGDVKRGGRHGDEGLKIGRETMQPIYDFVDRAGGKPFFIWYAPFLPHTPHNPPARLLPPYKDKGLGDELAKYYAMCEWLDETAGQLLGYLDKKGLRENTLVIFLADNGWVQTETPKSLVERRAKGSPYDAGLRTPILLRWPGKIRPGRDEKTPVSSVDLAPTILAACGLRREAAMPGVNLMDRERLRKREAIYGSIFVHTIPDPENPAAGLKYRWTVKDRWKLIVPYRPNAAMPMWFASGGLAATSPGWSPEIELFDILADPFERTDLASRHPDVIRSLEADLDRWWRPV